MLSSLLNGWNIVRIIRLILGVMLLVQAFQTKFWGAGLLGSLLLFQAITNTGCCGAGSCAVPVSGNNKNEKNTDNIEYEEVKEV